MENSVSQLERLWIIEACLVSAAMNTQTALEGVREQLRELQCVATEKICESTGAPCNSPEECDSQCVNTYEKGEYNPALPISFVESGRSAVGCSGEEDEDEDWAKREAGAWAGL